MITSVQNPRVQWARKLQAQTKARRQERAFVVEGVRLVEEALDADWQPRLALYTPDLSERGLALVQRFQSLGVPAEQVSEGVMEAASDTQSPQGVLAVIALLALPLPPAADFLLVVDGLRDPGNLGTLLRTAAAAGVQGVLLPPGTVDPFSPKVVRSAMGAHFRLPVLSLDWVHIQELLHPSGAGQRFQVFLADSAGGTAYTQPDFTLPTALIVGGEAEGAGIPAQELADTCLHIPMPGKVESLNAAVAAAVLLFEVVRQRKLS
jgi:TrmH family RNA methyltransferase